jgi:hypothetical protein
LIDALAHYLNFNEIIMAPKYRNNLKQSNLLITNKTLKINYPFVVYQIRNIASVDKRRFRPNYIKIFYTILTIIIYWCCMSIGLASLIKYYPKFSFLTLVVVSICYIILLINEFVKMIRRRNMVFLYRQMMPDR